MTGTQGNTIGAINPFRYRGYYWDEEIWLYYLNSRYYDAVTGRFLNADNCVSNLGKTVNGYNLFAYCFNNPINMRDVLGDWPEWISNTVSVVAAVAVVAAAVALSCFTFGSTAPLAVVAAAAIFGTVIGTSTNIAKQKLVDKKSWDKIDIKEVAISGAAGGVSGALAASPLGYAGQMVGNAIISSTASAVQGNSTKQVIEAGVVGVGAVAGAVGGRGAYAS